MSNSNLFNQEHKEAEQNQFNKEREKFIASLPKSEQKKFAAVEKAVQILVKADVPFYLFSELASSKDKEKKQIWQWNSLLSRIKFDNAGKITPESEAENCRFHESFFSSIFFQFADFFKGETMEEKLHSLPFFFHYCLVKNADYVGEKEKDEQD